MSRLLVGYMPIQSENNMKKTYIIITFIVITIFLVLITNLLQSGKKTVSNNLLSPTPIPTVSIESPTEAPSSNVPAQGKQYQTNASQIVKAEAPIIEKEAAVGRLLDLLPYQGKDFRMESDYKNAQYVVTIPKDKEKEGNAEFDTFLKQNGVAERSWIRDNLLVIRYE